MCFQAFRELQEKMISTQQQLKISDMQIEQQKHQITYANLVEKEIANLAPDTKTYEGVGRMYVLLVSSNIASYNIYSEAMLII